MKKKSAHPVDPETFLPLPWQNQGNSEYRSGDSIFTQGDIASDVFFLRAGRVTVSVVSKTGKEAIIGIVSANHFFGEGILTGQLKRISTAVAMEHCAVIRISKSVLFDYLRDDAEFSKIFMNHILLRNVRMEADLVDHLFNSSEKRLARTLLLLANFGKEGRPETVIPEITQATLAEMVGTTRSRVSFFMNKFRKLGFIEYNGKLHIHSSLLNVLLHDKN